MLYKSYFNAHQSPCLRPNYMGFSLNLCVCNFSLLKWKYIWFIFVNELDLEKQFHWIKIRYVLSWSYPTSSIAQKDILRSLSKEAKCLSYQTLHCIIFLLICVVHIKHVNSINSKAGELCWKLQDPMLKNV